MKKFKIELDIKCKEEFAFILFLLIYSRVY